MKSANRRRRFALAALLATAAIGSAAPAQASPADCETRLERIEAKFREIEEKRGWEAAAEWWEKRWQRYYERCLAP
jgi:hypothetical protein